MIKHCLICNREFITELNRINNGRGKYCSKECFYIAYRKIMKEKNGWLGRKHSEESKKKMSISAKNRFKKHGAKDYLSMQTWTYERRKKLSDAKIGLLCGEKNPLWKGGISNYPYPPEFSKVLREHIRQRDNFKCQLCGVSQTECFKKLIIHHVDYSKNNNSSNNLISLCQSCHSKTNSNRNYWENHFKDKYKEVLK